jgi:hypothetical protein
MLCTAIGVVSVGGVAAAEIVQQGTLRVSVSGALTSKHLPREGTAPVGVSVGWNVTTTDGSAPTKLTGVEIQINRHGRFDPTGLPVCPVARIQPASSTRALANCRSSLVGEGKFGAQVSLGGQEPYEVGGRLLVFNGETAGKPVLLGQIYAPHPFATSFVIVFKLKQLTKGSYGTVLTASIPRALLNWGNLTTIEMTLSRHYRFEGHQRSYISAGCPAPEGFGGAVFPLARTAFSFAGGATLRSTLTENCSVKP